MDKIQQPIDKIQQPIDKIQKKTHQLNYAPVKLWADICDEEEDIETAKKKEKEEKLKAIRAEKNKILQEMHAQGEMYE